MKQSHKVHMVPTDKPKVVTHTDIMINGIYQHLYITSDEEIKGNNEPCVYDDGKTKKICKAKEPLIYPYRKIVATTNKELWYKPRPESEGYSSLKEPLVAKIPQSFMEEYVKRKGDIEEVMLEVEEIYNYGGRTGDIKTRIGPHEQLKLNPNGEVIWSLKEGRMYTHTEVKAILSKGINQFMSDHESELFIRKWFNENYPE